MNARRNQFHINGIRVETYGRRSSRPPLLFVHGGCQGSWAWHKMAPYLAEEGWFSVCLNWFGHYGSVALSPPQALKRSILDVSTEIGAVVRHMAKVPVVIGHSMGGLASLAFATTQPVAGLVLLAPVVPAGFAAETIDLAVDPTTMWLPPPQLIDKAWWGEVTHAEARQYRSLICPESPQAVLEATRWLCRLNTHRLRAPALTFGAESDVLVPSHAVAALAASINADFIGLQNTGHGIPLNPVWADVALRIHEWLITTECLRRYE